jgi:hypothetical protein
MHNKIKLPFYSVIIITFLAISCSAAQEWPESPLYLIPESHPHWVPPLNKEEVMESIAGHYAHYDVVAYEDVTTKKPMKTFVISYGFTDFYIKKGKLYQVDRFCHAEQKIDQKYVSSSF